MLTTECNGEPYARAFTPPRTGNTMGRCRRLRPSTGAIQMFGRAYRGGERIRPADEGGQQLVPGEQIGWLSPGVIHEKGNAAFLRQVVRLRHALRRYFYAGEMARPPELQGKIPTVTADWQWHGRWPVTTSALLTGAWRQPKEGRLVLLFVNVSEEPLTATFPRRGSPRPPPRSVRHQAHVRRSHRSPSPFRPFRRAVVPRKAAWAWRSLLRVGGGR